MFNTGKENNDMSETMTNKFAELNDDELNSAVGGINVPKVKYVCMTCNEILEGNIMRDRHSKNTGHKYFSSEHKSC